MLEAVANAASTLKDANMIVEVLTDLLWANTRSSISMLVASSVEFNFSLASVAKPLATIIVAHDAIVSMLAASQNNVIIVGDPSLGRVFFKDTCR
jgi:hypothetical protein